MQDQIKHQGVFTVLLIGCMICSLKASVVRSWVFLAWPFLSSRVVLPLLIAGSILIPIYSQNLRGFSATQAGLITMPGSLVTAICSLLAGKLYDRIGIRIIATGGCAFRS